MPWMQLGHVRWKGRRSPYCTRSVTVTRFPIDGQNKREDQNRKGSDTPQGPCLGKKNLRSASDGVSFLSLVCLASARFLGALCPVTPVVVCLERVGHIPLRDSAAAGGTARLSLLPPHTEAAHERRLTFVSISRNSSLVILPSWFLSASRSIRRASWRRLKPDGALIDPVGEDPNGPLLMRATLFSAGSRFRICGVKGHGGLASGASPTLAGQRR